VVSSKSQVVAREDSAGRKSPKAVSNFF